MAGFLDEYGAGDEQRARRIKIIAVSVVALAVLSGILYFLFHNYSQERQARRFFQLLTAHDYQAAYNLWNRTEDDRRGYPLSKFMEDWGPQAMNVSGFDILDGESCGNSVIVDIDAGLAGDRKIWVNRETLDLSFPPYERGCPQRNRIYDFVRNMKYRLHGRTYQ